MDLAPFVLVVCHLAVDRSDQLEGQRRGQPDSRDDERLSRFLKARTLRLDLGGEVDRELVLAVPDRERVDVETCLMLGRKIETSAFVHEQSLPAAYADRDRRPASAHNRHRLRRASARALRRARRIGSALPPRQAASTAGETPSSRARSAGSSTRSQSSMNCWITASSSDPAGGGEYCRPPGWSTCRPFPNGGLTGAPPASGSAAARAASPATAPRASRARPHAGCSARRA